MFEKSARELKLKPKPKLLGHKSTLHITTLNDIKYIRPVTWAYSVYNRAQYRHSGGGCSVMVIVVGNGHGDTSSNPERYWLHFTLH